MKTTVIKPYLQLQGLANEQLGSLSYPVTVEMDEDAYEPPNDGNPPNYSVTHYSATNVQWNWTTSDGWKWNMNVDARTTTKLFTGGKAQINRQNLIQLQCDGVEYGRPDNSPDMSWPWVGVQRMPLNKSRLTALRDQRVGSDGSLWVALPDNAAMNLNVSAPYRHYYAWATPTKYKSYFQVFVRMPYPDYPKDYGEAHINPFYPYFRPTSVAAGHAWWKLTSDAPIDVIKQQLIKQQLTPDSTKWIGMETGFCPLYGLGIFIKNFANNIGYWDSRTDNCAEETLKTGGAVGVTLPSGSDDWLPEYFGYHLPPSTP